MPPPQGCTSRNARSRRRPFAGSGTMQAAKKHGCTTTWRRGFGPRMHPSSKTASHPSSRTTTRSSCGRTQRCWLHRHRNRHHRNAKGRVGSSLLPAQLDSEFGRVRPCPSLGVAGMHSFVPGGNGRGMGTKSLPGLSCCQRIWTWNSAVSCHASISSVLLPGSCQAAAFSPLWLPVHSLAQRQWVAAATVAVVYLQSAVGGLCILEIRL